MLAEKSQTIGLWCSTALLAALVSCSSPVTDAGPERTLQQETGSTGFGGETVANTVTTNGTIIALDADRRTIVLKYPDGRVAPYKAGPEVANFSLLKVGDEVQTTVADQVGISVVKAGTQPGASQTTSVVKGPTGTPGGTAVEAQKITGTVQQVNYDQHQVTLQLSGGQTRTVKVLDMINLSDLQQGDEVTINVTEAKTFLIEKK